MKTSLLIAGLALSLSRCPAPPVPPSPNDAPATCAGWCEHAQLLGCPAAMRTAEGASCVEVCENFQSSGFAAFDLACRVHAKSCVAADQCENK